MANMLQFRRRVHAIVRSSVRCFEEPSKFKGGISMPMLYCYIQTFFLDDMIHTEYIIYIICYIHTYSIFDVV